MNGHYQRVGLLLVGIVLTSYLSICAYKEYYRLGHGFQLDLLRFPGRVVRMPNFTHATGPAFSLFANADISHVNFRSYTGGGRGKMKFRDGSVVEYYLTATFKQYESEIHDISRNQPSLGAEIVITKKFIEKLKFSKGSPLTLRGEGNYFVAFLRVENPSDIPKDGIISIIVH